jgi:hypothetical protein
MSFTMTRTVSDSFTLTQAKYLASKVTADMRRCQQLYGDPSDSKINDLGTELSLLLRDGYLRSFEFGYVRSADDERVLTWLYTVDSSGNLTSNDRPGRIISGVDLGGTRFRNYLVKSTSFFNLSDAEQNKIEESLPIKRTSQPEYGSSLGSWQNDLTYSATGVAMVRRNFKPYGV